MKDKNRKITIVGGGPTGSLLAIELGKRGYCIDVYERRHDPKNNLVNHGRSINLALSARGLASLEKVGLKESILNVSIPMMGRQIHNIDGSQNFQAYGRNESEHLNAISRSHLNNTLILEAQKNPNIKYYFCHNALGADFINNRLLVRDDQMGQEKEVDFDLVFATDGAASKIRSDLLRYHDQHHFERDDLTHCYKELVIPAASDGAFQIEKERLHIWPRGGFMLIALPNLDGSFTCTLFLANSGENSMESLKTVEDVNEFFKKHFPDALKLMPTLAHDFFHHPTGHLYTIHCFPWCVEGKLLLLGDSAHAVVPFLGQGMNACFEDVRVLVDIMDANPELTWENIFKRFETERFPNTEAIAQMAIDNFLEMRDHVGRAKFLLKKQVEHYLMENYPAEYLSKYNLVTFGLVPYAYAQKVGHLQDAFLDKLVGPINTFDQFKSMDKNTLDKQIMQYLTEEKKLRNEFTF